MLPEIKKVTTKPNVFQTTWQAVIFRNYGLVPNDVLANLLDCDIKTLQSEALRLGLKNVTATSNFNKKSYITLIRNNWLLLPYEQICTLISVSEDRLDFILQNDDFLSIKLGSFKPYCEKVKYYPLTAEQIEKTEVLSAKIQRLLQRYEVNYFDFFAKNALIEPLLPFENGTRIVHGYLSPCGDVFMEDDKEYMPDSLLQNYKKLGITGVWLHGLLAKLSPYPFDETLSKDYQLRRKNLQLLINRCKKFGLKVYLYFNEPRSLPNEKFGKYAHLKGRTENGYSSLCFCKQETQNYLYNAVKDLLTHVKDLGGIITITMSENLTHCNFLPNTNCPICKNIPAEKSASDVNNVIQKAIRDSGEKTELIANLWGWSPFTGWSEEQTLKGIELLDKDISVMCVSEYDLEIEKGGIKSKIIDYSMSNPGPSQITKKALKKASEKGHKIYAKIQANNSWECSAIPYLPVFDLLYEHLQNLYEIGVKDYMLTWTLGGYPSPMLGMVSKFAQNPDGFNLDEWYREQFGENFSIVKQAVNHFCEGFREYPFSLDELYFSPKTLGPANLWSLEDENMRSTMVCYSFDDYENWIKPYSIEVYLSQYEKLIKNWEEGCKTLDNVNSPALSQLKIFAKVALCHFKSSYLQTSFAYSKRNIAKNKTQLKTIIKSEKDNAILLLDMLYKNACVGFEASNHYYYTDRNIIEKILLMDSFLDKF